MGLDIGCECGQVGFRAGSYSGFNAYRCWVAQKMGNKLRSYRLIGDHMSQYPIYNAKDPFFHLFNHSDCDGTLTVRQCRALIPAFQGLLDRVRKEARGRALAEPGRTWAFILEGQLAFDGDEEWFFRKTKEWLDACRHAVEASCRLVFV